MPRTKESAPRKSSMTLKLSQIIKGKKVMVFIDGSNLYYMISKTKKMFSYETFENWLQSKSDLINIHYYTAFDPEDSKQTDFLTELERLKYIMHKKPIKWVIDHHKGNMDVELAVDAISLAKDFEVMVLLSGDGDFSYLCKALEKIGKKTIVISLGGYTAPELHDSADNYFFMERVSSIWKPARRKTSNPTTPKTQTKSEDVPVIHI